MFYHFNFFFLLTDQSPDLTREKQTNNKKLQYFSHKNDITLFILFCNIFSYLPYYEHLSVSISIFL